MRTRYPFENATFASGLPRLLGATFYIIGCEPDYQGLANTYPQKWNEPNVSFSHPCAPDWHPMSGDIPFDGVHVTNGAPQL